MRVADVINQLRIELNDIYKATYDDSEIFSYLSEIVEDIGQIAKEYGIPEEYIIRLYDYNSSITFDTYLDKRYVYDMVKYLALSRVGDEYVKFLQPNKPKQLLKVGLYAEKFNH